MKGASVASTSLGLLLAMSLVSSVGGCGALQDLLGSQRPTARIAGVSLQDIKLDSATLLFDVEVDNPYSVPLPLVNVDYNLASGGAPFLSGKADLQGTVPAKDKKTVSLPAKVPFMELLSALKGVRPGAVVPYEAELGLSLDAPALGVLRLPLKKEGKLPVPAAPEVQVSEIKWDKMTLEEAGGHVKLHLVNRNQFPVELSKLTYALSLGEVEVANSSLAKALAFEADGGGGAVELPISFSPRKLGLAVFSMLAGQGSGYGLTGTLDVQTPFGPMSLPMDKVGETIFRR